MTAPGTHFDPTHTCPPPVSRDDLQAAVVNAHGQFLHLEHVAEAAHHTTEASLAHHAAGLLARLMWAEATA